MLPEPVCAGTVAGQKLHANVTPQLLCSHVDSERKLLKISRWQKQVIKPSSNLSECGTLCKHTGHNTHEASLENARMSERERIVVRQNRKIMGISAFSQCYHWKK